MILLLVCFLTYLDDVCYANDLKIYYNKPLTVGKEAYNLANFFHLILYLLNKLPLNTFEFHLKNN